MQNTTEYKPSRSGVVGGDVGHHSSEECASNPADFKPAGRAVILREKRIACLSNVPS